MTIFKLQEDQMRKGAGWLDAPHKWGLPGIECPTCRQIWSTVGLEYPSVDLTNLPDENLFRKARVEPFDEYLHLRKIIQDAFPHLQVLEPGTVFGPMVGKAKGRKLDGFVWAALWSTISLEQSAFEKLKKSGLSLPVAVKAELTFKKDPQEVFEFDLPLHGKLVNVAYDHEQLRLCNTCGREGGMMPKNPIIDISSVPKDVEIFRVRNFATLIMVTERFKTTIEELGIKGALFRETSTT